MLYRKRLVPLSVVILSLRPPVSLLKMHHFMAETAIGPACWSVWSVKSVIFYLDYFSTFINDARIISKSIARARESENIMEIYFH